MTELLRKVFIVTGIIGALEVTVLAALVVYYISRPYVRIGRGKRSSDG